MVNIFRKLQIQGMDILVFFNKYDSVKLILRNIDGSIIQIKIFNTGELINIDEVIDRQNSLVNFNDKAVIIKDLWGNFVEWNLTDVSSKLVKLR